MSSISTSGSRRPPNDYSPSEYRSNRSRFAQLGLTDKHWNTFEKFHLGNGERRTNAMNLCLIGTPMFIWNIVKAISDEKKLLKNGFTNSIGDILVLHEDPRVLNCNASRRHWRLQLDGQDPYSDADPARFRDLSDTESARFAKFVDEPVAELRKHPLVTRIACARPWDDAGKAVLQDYQRFVLLVAGSHFWCPHEGLREFTGEWAEKISASELPAYLEKNATAKRRLKALRALQNGVKLASVMDTQFAVHQLLSSSEKVTQDLAGTNLVLNPEAYAESILKRTPLGLLEELIAEARKEIHQGVSHGDNYLVHEPGFDWVCHTNTVVSPGGKDSATGAGPDGLKDLAGPKPFVSLARQCVSQRPMDRLGCMSLLKMVDGEFDAIEAWDLDGSAFPLKTRPPSENEEDIRRAARKIVDEMAVATGDLVVSGLTFVIAKRIRALTPHWRELGYT